LKNQLPRQNDGFDGKKKIPGSYLRKKTPSGWGKKLPTNAASLRQKKGEAFVERARSRTEMARVSVNVKPSGFADPAGRETFHETAPDFIGELRRLMDDLAGLVHEATSAIPS